MRGRLAIRLGWQVVESAQDPPPATFRLLVSPMVQWIWIGALIVLFGAGIAGWPQPRALGRRASAAYAARVGREARTMAQV